ncbi:M23 family metallopeptidase [Candidatus Protofrankia datiscae]|uniref:M23 family metallopeptidase n=2 Tax=Protofrankia TaxID=2994361 RepID=UPI001ED95D6E|nr:M23 family metallopeptidase [Candidatus Protofrankia datiscae]
MSQPSARDSGRHRGHGRATGHSGSSGSARRTASAAQIRRTGIATAVVSTLGIVMINTTGIAHSDPAVISGLRTAGTIFDPASGGVTDAATDGLSDPALLERQRDGDAARRQAQADRVDRDEALAQMSILLLQQRTTAAEAVRRQDELRWVRPIQARITQRFGGANGHPGIDLGAPMGTQVVAAYGGTVIYAGWESGYGNFVQVRHANNVVTCYAHLSRISVRVGQQVATGQQVGLEGSTGFSTGPHLHFEVRLGGQNGTKVDPLAWLAKHNVYY